MTNKLSDKLHLGQTEAERLFCGCVFAGSEIAVAECGWLSPKIFIDEKLSKYWKSVMDGEDAMQAAVNQNLMYELAGVVTQIPSVARPDIHANNIAKYYYLRKQLSNAGSLVKLIGEEDISEIQIQTGNMADDRPLGAPVNTGKITDLSDELLEMINNPPRAVTTHITELDNAIGGLYPGELVIVAGRPGMGKTTFALQIARLVADYGLHVVFFSLEMSSIQIWAKMVCGSSGYEWRDVRAGRVDQTAINIITQESKALESKLKDTLYIVDAPGMSVFDIHKICVHRRPNIVVIDQLPEIAWHDPSESVVLWYGKACNYLRTYIARKLSIPVILIHQLNRGVEERGGDKRPLLADLRQSGEIEQRADIVLMVYREDYYKGRGKGQTIVPFEVWVRKHRQGCANSQIILEYDLKTQTIK